MSDQLQPIFERVRALFKVHEKSCVLLGDDPGRYYLAAHKVRAKDGYRTHFGGVEVKKNYVSAHLMPVYMHPEMLEDVSAELRKRMQGKSCFNFKVMDDELLAELGQLIDRGADRFQADGRL